MCYYCCNSDRKKDLVKLQAGEYVALGKIESELKTCPLVDNICVYGDSSKHFTVALIVPNQKHLKDLAVAQGISDTTLEHLCSLPAIEKAVLKILIDHGLKCKWLHSTYTFSTMFLQFLNGKSILLFLYLLFTGKLQKSEIPAAITLCKDVWTPDSGLVTAAFKLKRKDIQVKYQADINRMYS